MAEGSDSSAAEKQIYANLKNSWIEEKPSEICSLLVIQKNWWPFDGQLLAKMAKM